MEKIIIFGTILFAIGCQGLENGTKSQTITTSTIPVSVTTTHILREQQEENFKLELPGKKILNAIQWIISFTSGETFIGRCLGAARRLKFVMPFLLFKMGVIVTTLGFLTLFTLKGLGIGVLLLILNAGGIFGKLALLKHQTHPPKERYIPISPPQAPPAVHLHVHKDPHGGHYEAQGHGGHYDTYDGHGGYASVGPTAWSDRISQGLSETKTLAEKLELINLYKRLGLNVNSVLKQQGGDLLQKY